MRAEDAEELLNVFMREFYRIDAGMLDTIRHCIAAVYPLIAKAERERAAVWHDEQAAGEDALAEHAIGADRDAWLYHRHTAATHRESAAAIRALGDGERGDE